MGGLDTSGAVWVDPVECPGIGWLWSDLSPFAQGYVEALLHSYSDALTVGLGEALHVGFSDLAPEALAMIIRDCEERTQFHSERAVAPQMGAAFWRNRQTARYAGFPPLRVHLNDAGRVALGQEGTTPADGALGRRDRSVHAGAGEG